MISPPSTAPDGTDFAAAASDLSGRQSRSAEMSLRGVGALLAGLGNPHRGHRGCLVAGTNGKGSVCAMVDAICRAAGLRTVRLTKPHLLSWCERIAVDGEAISEARFAQIHERVEGVARRMPEAPARFDILTAMGALVAAEESPDVLICEVGMGGRLDSTNIFDLGMAVISGVGLDHCQVLGSSIPLIAGEKAAIIKPGNTVICGADSPACEVVDEYSSRAGAQAAHVHGSGREVAGGTAVEFAGGRWFCNLHGEHQIDNATVALAVCAEFRRQGMAIEEAAMAAGLAQVRWPGRLQIIPGQPDVVLDAGHNPQAVAAASAAAARLMSGRPPTVIFAAMRDKDVQGMLRALASISPRQIIFTRGEDARFASPAGLQLCWESLNLAVPSLVCPDTASAWVQAQAGAAPEGWILITGSLALVGQFLTYFDS